MNRHFGLWRTAFIGLMTVAFLAVSVPAMADQCCPQAGKVDCKKDCKADCKKDCKKDCKSGDKCDRTNCCPSTTNDAGIKSTSATARTTGAVAKAAANATCCPDKSSKCCPQGSGKCCPTGVTTKSAPPQEKAKKSRKI